MKKLKIFIILTFLPLFLVQSQDLKFGLFVQPNINWMSTKAINIENSKKIGFGYGAVVDYFFSERYAFSTGLTYNHLGGDLQYDQDIEDNFYDLHAVYRLQYIEIPLTLKMVTSKLDEDMSFFGRFGLNPGILTSSRKDFTMEEDSDLEDIINEKASENLRIFNMNLLLQAGVQYHISSDMKVFGGIIFNNGFNNVIQEKKKDVYIKEDTEKISLKTFGIQLGVIF